jgi:hypothetical protein
LRAKKDAMRKHILISILILVALCCDANADKFANLYKEKDPCYNAWVAIPPNVSTFVDDANYLQPYSTSLKDSNLVMLVSSTPNVPLSSTQNGNSFTLYTVPSDSNFYPVYVVVRDANNSLAGGSSYSFPVGGGLNWRSNVSLAGLTIPGDGLVVVGGWTGVSGIGVYSSSCKPSASFQITVNTGCTASGATATIDVYGLLKPIGQ